MSNEAEPAFATVKVTPVASSPTFSKPLLTAVVAFDSLPTVTKPTFSLPAVESPIVKSVVSISDADTEPLNFAEAVATILSTETDDFAPVTSSVVAVKIPLAGSSLTLFSVKLPLIVAFVAAVKESATRLPSTVVTLALTSLAVKVPDDTVNSPIALELPIFPAVTSAFTVNVPLPSAPASILPTLPAPFKANLPAPEKLTPATVDGSAAAPA